MGLFMGAGRGLAPGSIIPHDDFTYRNYLKMVAGHNLPGKVVSDFVDRSLGERDPRLALSDTERAFLDTLQPRADGQRFNLIGLSVQSVKPQESIFSHEIFHAYFELRPAYRAVVERFWRDAISKNDRARITTEVGKGYNVDDERLVVDEFHAYLLQENAGLDRMKSFVERYRVPLIEALRREGQLPDLVAD